MVNNIKIRISENSIDFEVNDLIFPVLIGEILMVIQGKKQIHAINDTFVKKTMILSLNKHSQALHFKPLFLSCDEIEIPIFQIIEKINEQKQMYGSYKSIDVIKNSRVMNLAKIDRFVRNHNLGFSHEKHSSKVEFLNALSDERVAQLLEFVKKEEDATRDFPPDLYRSWDSICRQKGGCEKECLSHDSSWHEVNPFD